MPWSTRDLVFYTGSVYGIAWLLTKSKIFRRVRELLSDWPFVGALLKCIVCTATWVHFAAVALLPATSLFSTGFRVLGLVDLLALTGWTLGATWMIAKLLGDATTEPEGPTP